MSNAKVDESGALRDEVCLMHWAGPNKPWIKGHESQIHSEFWAVYGTPATDEEMERASGDVNTNKRADSSHKASEHTQISNFVDMSKFNRSHDVQQIESYRHAHNYSMNSQ